MAILGFPESVNEKAARAVAAQVLAASALTLVLSAVVSTGWLWLTVALAAGFLARVLTGPTLSPFGQLATRVLAPRLGAHKPVAGTPKRFAQGVGLVVTVAASVALALGVPGLTQLLLGVLIVAAGLEAVAGFCLGCHMFALLIRVGIVPERVCVECADVSARLRTASAV